MHIHMHIYICIFIDTCIYIYTCIHAYMVNGNQSVSHFKLICFYELGW